MKRQLYSIGGGAIKGTDAGNGREGFFRPVPGSPMQNHPLAGGMGPIQLGGFGPRQPRQLPMGVLPQEGEQAIYPRLGDLRSGVSSAEQELQQINQSIDEVQSDLGSPTGGGFGDYSSIINPIRPGVPTSQLGTQSPLSSVLGFGGVGDPRLGAPIIPGNQLQMMMRGARANGGIMSVAPRQQYGLGSFVKKAIKKVTGAVKDIAGSDLGKLALTAGALYGLGGIGGGVGFGRFAPSALKAGLLGTVETGGSLYGGGILSGLMNTGVGQAVATGLSGGVGKGMLTSAAIGGLTGFLSQQGMSPEEIETVTRNPEALKSYLRQYYSKLNPDATPMQIDRFVEANTAEYRAEGGRIGYEEGTPEMGMIDPNKAKQVKQMIGMGADVDTISSITGLTKEQIEFLMRENKAYGGRMGFAMGNPEENAVQASGIMGLPLNQNPAGITELDLRETGGFIPPVGVKEKADDIPAMLSNNEFVFTADAVRGMGDGNVNKGAQRMYDMMKKLENGGRV